MLVLILLLIFSEFTHKYIRDVKFGKVMFNITVRFKFLNFLLIINQNCRLRIRVTSYSFVTQTIQINIITIILSSGLKFYQFLLLHISHTLH